MNSAQLLFFHLFSMLTVFEIIKHFTTSFFNMSFNIFVPFLFNNLYHS